MEPWFPGSSRACFPGPLYENGALEFFRVEMVGVGVLGYSLVLLHVWIVLGSSCWKKKSKEPV